MKKTILISVLYCDGIKVGHDQARVLLLHPRAHPAAAKAAAKKEDRVRSEDDICLSRLYTLQYKGRASMVGYGYVYY